MTAEEMRAADEHAINDLKIPSLTLMENAASRVTEIALRNDALRVLVVCGKGNNGGDGLAVARMLKDAGRSPSVLLIGKASELKADPAENWKRALASQIPCVEDPEALLLEEMLAESELVIDAIFGTGLTKAVEGPYSSSIQKINRSGKEILSIDVPSGMKSDSGALIGPCLRAHSTVALAALKYCHIQSPASKMCGEIHVVEIGIPASSNTVVVRSGDLRRLLPHRPVDSHKGTYGHAVVIGGSTGKSGAAYLSGKSALRCGAGLVTVVCPSQIQPVIAAHGPEIMTFPSDPAADVNLFLADKTAAAIGPGMGISNDAKQLFDAVLSQFQGPLVIDADGLNHLSRDVSALARRKKCSTVLTPHPGEMGRLMNTDTASVQKDRVGAARKVARTTQSIMVLKGYRTVIAHPEGKVWIVPTGGQALASAGTGDVLTGIITGFLSQGLKPLEAAVAGVYIHGLTANLFEAKFPQQAMNALDILQWWNEAVHLVRSGKDVESEYLKIHFTF